MNAVEIEEAVAQLAIEPFDAAEFPFAFLAAFDNKPATIARLRAGATNASDVAGGVLQRNHIHLATCSAGQVTQTLAALKASPKTAKAKAKFVLATDGEQIEAQDLVTDEPLACPFEDLGKHFGFFLPLAGITTVQEIKDNPIDIKATGRLFKLYVQLLNDNPEWATEARRHDLNQFMARLIFCFFAEDTGIFFGNGLFSQTIAQMSDATNTHEVIGELFRAMDIPIKDREAAKLRPWADVFPYVNGGLFTGTRDTPHFSRMARAYLLSVGELDWKHINPDIFGSMIQGIEDDQERGSLGLHYTSVPNILRVLDPLFLDGLRESLDEAGDNARKLLNLRKRISAIRVFDPACGSGNFLVIAYIKMREIEAEIIRRRNDEKKSWINLTNFYGIEIKDFACETARLSLLIAEFQCDARLIGQREACINVLPLKRTGQIRCGNALEMDWHEVCPAPGDAIERDLAGPTGRLNLGDHAAPAEVETYICGNPPYKGSNWQTPEQRSDLKSVLSARTTSWKSLDYVTGWFIKACDYASKVECSSAFVTTSSICQGQQVGILWPMIFEAGRRIDFAHTPFKWSNLASNNAGVTVAVIGLNGNQSGKRRLFAIDETGATVRRDVDRISAYLLSTPDIIVSSRSTPLCFNSRISDGSGALDGGHLILDERERSEILTAWPTAKKFIRPYLGSNEFIKGLRRWCLWISDEQLNEALECPPIAARIRSVKEFRASAGTRARTAIGRPHKFAWINAPDQRQLIIPTIFSEHREYLTAGLLDADVIVNNAASIVHEPTLHEFAILSSRMHIAWVKAVAGRLEDRVRYTSGTCYNTFPFPKLTAANRNELAACGAELLVAREANFPAAINQLYEEGAMPDDLRRAHERNDEVVERFFIGRRFRNDTERLERLFELYAKMTAVKNHKEAT